MSRFLLTIFVRAPVIHSNNATIVTINYKQWEDALTLLPPRPRVHVFPYPPSPQLPPSPTRLVVA